MSDLDLRDCIIETYCWSRKPVAEHSLTTYKGHVIGY